MFLTDQPIQTSSQDFIGRRFFADSLAETILSYDAKNELVLGLYGEWGSGKTSLLNLTIEKLKDRTKDETNKPVIVKFNPWNFSEQNHLITQYFSILSTILKRKDNSENLIEVGKKLEEYSNIFEPLSIIPVVGQFTFLAKLGMKIFGNSLKLKGKNQSRNLDQLREELNTLLRKLNNKIIVIIDDIDRLTPYEIRQIFQLVKKIADFPNVIYLLAFDKEVVLNALKEVHSGFEEQYLEKIIQVPFEIPSLSKEEVYQFLVQQIERILVDLPQKEFDEMYWSNIFNTGIKYYFNSIRDVSRFTNSFAFNYSLVKGGVNPVDFIAITTMQVFHSKLYHLIKTNKGLFAGYSDQRNRDLFDTDSKEKEYYSSLIPDHKEVPQKVIEELLTRLFPKLESVFGNTSYGAEWNSEWRKKARVCSEEYFDIYFRLTIDKSELTPKTMELILSSAKNSSDFKSALLSLSNENKINKFLDLLEDYTSDQELIPEENIQNIVSTLMDIGDTFPEDENVSFFTFDTSMRILRIFYQLSRRYDDHDSRYRLFKTAIESAEKSLYTIVHEVGVQDQQHGKYSDDKQLPLNKLTVKPDQLDHLHNLALEKIEKWAEHSKLSTHNHLVPILYRWREWKDIDTVKKYVKELISTEEGKVKFVTAFLNHSVSYGMGDYGGKINWRIDLKNMEEFVSLKEIEPTLRSIKEKTINKYTEKQQLAIKTFFDFYDGKKKIQD